MVSETLENGKPNSSSGGAFLDWRTHQTRFDALALTAPVSYNLRGEGAPERLTGMEVSHEFLQVLGIPPLLGRGFLPEEDRPGGRQRRRDDHGGAVAFALRRGSVDRRPPHRPRRGPAHGHRRARRTARG